MAEVQLIVWELPTAFPLLSEMEKVVEGLVAPWLIVWEKVYQPVVEITAKFAVFYVATVDWLW